MFDFAKFRAENDTLARADEKKTPMGDELTEFPFNPKFTMCILVKSEDDAHFETVKAGIPGVENWCVKIVT